MIQQDVTIPPTSDEKLISFFIDEVLLFWDTNALLKSYSPHLPIKKKNQRLHKVIPQLSAKTATKPATPQSDKRELEIKKVTTTKPKENSRIEAPTNWQLNPLMIDPSSDEFLKLNFKCLKNSSLKPLYTPAAVILFSPLPYETLFFQRFTKSVTQFFFPCRLLFLQEKTIDFKTSFQSYEIIILNHQRISKFFKDIVPHEPYVYEQIKIISILSYEDYQQDPQLKKQLWTQLQQLTMSVMRK